MSGTWLLAFIALWAVVVTVAVLVLGLLRRVAVVLERAEGAFIATQVNLGGAGAGVEVGSFEAVDSEGVVLPMREILEHPAVVLVMHSGCGPCRQLSERLRSDTQQLDVPLIVLLDASPAARSLQLPSYARVFYDREGDALSAFKGGGTPQAFAVEGGVIVDTLVPGSFDDIERLAGSVSFTGGRRLRWNQVAERKKARRAADSCARWACSRPWASAS